MFSWWLLGYGFGIGRHFLTLPRGFQSGREIRTAGQNTGNRSKAAGDWLIFRPVSAFRRVKAFKAEKCACPLTADPDSFQRPVNGYGELACFTVLWAAQALGGGQGKADQSAAKVKDGG